MRANKSWVLIRGSAHKRPFSLSFCTSPAAAKKRHVSEGSEGCPATANLNALLSTLPPIDAFSKPGKTYLTEQDEKPQKQRNLIGMTKEELLEEINKQTKVEGYRIKQLWNWIYYRGVTDFRKMLNLPKALQGVLDEHYVIDYGQVKVDNLSQDGTRKWLLDFGGQEVESVFIPEVSRGTLCVSSQVGCTMSCKFCHTGTQPVVRNLLASEIIGQFLTARQVLLDQPTHGRRVVSNVVFMGQGEPFYNYRNVSKALKIMTDKDGIALSKRRVTVSTSGVVPIIRRLGEDFKGIKLAISLHAPRDSIRDEIVPINRQYPIAELLDACRNFPGLSWTHKITFEYVMLKGVNDSDADANELVRILRDIPCHVNLIPFNPWPGSPFECSSRETINRFANLLISSGIDAPIRWPRGRDILAACGQLKTATQQKRAKERMMEEQNTQHQSVLDSVVPNIVGSD